MDQPSELGVRCANISIPDESLGPACASFPLGAINFAGTAAYGPGLAEAGAGKLLMVWQGTSGSLSSNLITLDAAGAVSTASTVTLPGAITSAGDVTAVTPASGVVKAWAPSGNRLKQWTYPNGVWPQPVDQQWADGSFISPRSGIGATMGYQDSGAVANSYAAIPSTSTGVIEFARQESSGGNAGRWTKLSSWAVEPRGFSSGRPGLAYQRGTSQANQGRF